MNIVLALVFFGVAFALAFLVEGFVEYAFGAPFDHIEKAKPFKWLLMYIALAIGVLLCLFYGLDLIVLIAYVISLLAGGAVVWPTTTVGMILSGVVIGRGANYLHDFLMAVLKKPPVPIGG